jgi:hypothetical protein
MPSTALTDLPARRTLPDPELNTRARALPWPTDRPIAPQVSRPQPQPQPQLQPLPAQAQPERDRRAARKAPVLLLAGCAATGLLAYAAGHPQARLLADPGLAWLLRGMALIKGGLVAAALALTVWRLRQPQAPSTRAAAGYIACGCLMTASTVLIWQLSFIVPAAVAFHVGLIGLLWIGWRDGLPAKRLLTLPSAGALAEPHSAGR